MGRSLQKGRSVIALAPSPNSSAPRPPGKLNWPARFLLLLPLIRRIARHAFRGLPGDQRQEALQEVVANCFVAYARLVERGKEEVGYATPLARYAVAQYRSGRRVGNSVNIHDVTGPLCQQRNDVVVETLFPRTEEGRWEELVVEDKRSTPADIATTRLDFKAWLRRLDRPKRAAARLLADGAATSDAAKRLRVSPSRISQLRRELMEDWEEFQSEALEPTAS
jgi:hypothetical protein